MFTATSWVEHLRQHERVTMADRAAEARAAAFRRSSEPLRIAHLLAAPRPASEPVPCLDEHQLAGKPVQGHAEYVPRTILARQVRYTVLAHAETA